LYHRQRSELKAIWEMNSQCRIIILLPALILCDCKRDSPTTIESQPLESPTLVLQDTSHTGGYIVRWTRTTGATSYELQEDETSLFSSPSAAYSGSDTSIAISKFHVATFYYRIRAVNGTVTSGWSATRAIAVVQPIVASIVVFPSPLNFGYAAVDSSKVLPLLIENNGIVQLTISFSLTGFGVFSLVDSSAFSLSPGTFRIANVRFFPTSADTFRGVLSILSPSLATLNVSLLGTSMQTSGQPDTILVLGVSLDTLTIYGGPGPTTAIVGFEVRDSLNRPLDLAHQHTVQFVLTGPPTNGGAYVSPQSVLTNGDGRVFTTVNSGISSGILECVARIVRTSDGRILLSRSAIIYVQ